VGDFKHIGQIIHNSKGPSNHNAESVMMARNALYTKVRSDEYYPDLRRLDEIEVHLGLGRC
jgi:hypothetical protein